MKPVSNKNQATIARNSELFDAAIADIVRGATQMMRSNPAAFDVNKGYDDDHVGDDYSEYLGMSLHVWETTFHSSQIMERRAAKSCNSDPNHVMVRPGASLQVYLDRFTELFNDTEGLSDGDDDSPETPKDQDDSSH